jgi:hypothetical protein
MKLYYLAFALMAGVPAWADSAVYSSLPAPLPPNTPSEGYEAQSLAEFGDLVQLANGPAVLLSATVAMSDWAYESEFSGSLNGSTITPDGFYVPLTLTLYSVGAGNSVGLPIQAFNLDALIPWRPEPNPTGCPTGPDYPNNINNQWQASNGTCYNGALSTVTFDLGSILAPGQFIYGLAFDTTNYGSHPTNVAGPYDSLNFGVTPAASGPSVGSNPVGYNYVAQHGGGFGPSGYDSSSIGQIEFDSTPEPANMTLAGMALLGLFLGLRRARSRAQQRLPRAGRLGVPAQG